MAGGPNLPAPAKGDIYTYGGKLKVTNAAANVFVIYDRCPESAARPPSSLSVEFVMGNVYLIDSSLFAPFKRGDLHLFGNLVKGLGLQADGCRKGDTSIETVYDDIVCVVTSHRGANCSIGAIASNLVTVTDLTCRQDHRQPQNVTAGYVHGLTLEESHLASGGGLRRAESAWASMSFPQIWRHASPSGSVAYAADGGRLNTDAGGRSALGKKTTKVPSQVTSSISIRISVIVPSLAEIVGGKDIKSMNALVRWTIKDSLTHARSAT
ncbi:hypothetical protein EsH8_VII_000615 [Colletotrichum jinshuiense]